MNYKDLVSLEVILKEIRLVYKSYEKHDKILHVDIILNTIDNLLHKKELSNNIFDKETIFKLNEFLDDSINYFTSKGLINVGEESIRLKNIINNENN